MQDVFRIRDFQVANRLFVGTGKYEIEVAGERIPALASLQPWYDPKSFRVKV